jgi:predicted O-methyltransferase YrrM
MLEKTLAMLTGLAPGTYVPDDQVCFDEAEISALGRALVSLVYAPSQLRRRLQDLGVSIVPSNFYSEIPTVRDLEQSFASDRVTGFDYVFDDAHMLQTLDNLTQYSSEFDPPAADDGSGGFYWKNSQFSASDAMAYYCMIRQRKPKTILEIGSGFSTLVASAAVQKNGFGEIICIEPYPRDFLSKVPGVREIITQSVQSVPPSFFNEHLADQDLLFIDSTHTVKHDSDCVHIYLRVLPLIQANILVHAHDIYFPRTLSLKMLRDHQIFWTEQYLLYAYLIDNRRTTVSFSSAYSSSKHRQALDTLMGGRFSSGGGSIWFDQSGR